MAAANETADEAFEVRRSEELGRYIVAARDLSPGDLVLTERPIVFAPKAMLIPEIAMPCVGCYKRVYTETAERCPRCGWPVCAGNCPGLTDPQHHGLECVILSARPQCMVYNMVDYYRHEALLCLRCLLLQKADPEGWKKILEMQSHMESRTPGTEVYDDANEFVVEYLMNNFIDELDPNVRREYVIEATPELLHRICGIIDTNALEIRLQDRIELFALYAKTCLIEHSCVPNTKHTFNLSAKDKNDMYNIRVKVVVPVSKGEHLSTMYTHALWGTKARREHLKETKYFSCSCPRCRDPTELGSFLSAMKCPGEGNKICDGAILPEDPLDDNTGWSCNKCSAKLSSSVVDETISQIGHEIEEVMPINRQIPYLESLVCRFSTILHPNHYHLYSLKHSLAQSYVNEPEYSSQEYLEKKIKICRDLLNTTKILDPRNARLSLYSAILNNELHFALMTKAISAKEDGSPKTVEDMKPLLIEAKAVIEAALDDLEDECEEDSGKELFPMFKNREECFKRFCNERNFNI